MGIFVVGFGLNFFLQTAEQVDVDDAVIGKRKIVPIGNSNTFLGMNYLSYSHQ